jgi:hypothetical protein
VAAPKFRSSTWQLQVQILHSTKMIHHIISFAVLFFFWRLSSSFQKGKELLPRKIIGKSFSLPTKASKERPQISNNQDGSELSIGIACARWNSDIVTGLYEVRPNMVIVMKV